MIYNQYYSTNDIYIYIYINSSNDTHDYFFENTRKSKVIRIILLSQTKVDIILDGTMLITTTNDFTFFIFLLYVFQKKMNTINCSEHHLQNLNN